MAIPLPPPAALASALVLLLPASVLGQQPLRGTVLDGAQRPVAGAVVVLHSVSQLGGNELARDTTAADGEFLLMVPADAQGLLFAATRLEDDLFVGATFRGQPPSDYVLPAGPGVAPFPMATGAAARTRPAPPVAREQSSGVDVVWVAAIALLLAAATVVLIRRARDRPSASRELMLRIARLDQRAGAEPGNAASAQRLARQREALVRQLEEAVGADRPAHT